MTRAGRLLVLAQGADALTFALFYALGGPALTSQAERNPLVLAMLALGGYQLVALVKIGLAAWVGRRRRVPRPSRFAAVRLLHERHPQLQPRALRFAMGAATLSGAVGAGFNLAALVPLVLLRTLLAP